MFIAEMGDKTQLVMIAMSSRYRLRDIIIGSGASILSLNAMAVLLGTFISSLIPEHIVKIVAALAFLYFAWSSLFKNEEEQGDAKKGNVLKSPKLAIFWTFFVAEFGDKTQLTAITFAADAGSDPEVAIIVCIACSLGLFLADLIGMLVGDIIKRHTEPHFMDRLAFILFFIFGIMTAREALFLMGITSTVLLILVCGILALIFLAICLFTPNLN